VYSIGALSGGEATLETRRYAHRSMPHVVGIDFTFNNTAGTTTLVSNISQPSSWGSSAASLSTKDTAWTHSSSASMADGATCWAGSIEMSEDPSFPLIHLGLCTTDLRSAPMVVSVPAGQTKTYTVLAAIYSTLDHPSPLVPAQADLKTTTSMTVESRWQAHISAVDEVLESGIEISGNHDLAKLVNSSFHTLVAALRAEPEYWYSSSPGGLATDCYTGHTFWGKHTEVTHRCS
jgi:trehalose/maltose hydrolase-like predicted phosphorylase